MSQRSEFTPVPAGKIAAVVTYIEMRERPRSANFAPRPGCVLRRVDTADSGWYLDLHRRIGEELLWFSRTVLEPEALRAILDDPNVEVYALHMDGADEGLLELDFREQGQCKLAYFGVTPALVGKGAGRWLMGKAIEIAWSRPIARFWTHTCTLDHPNALPFYLRCGFTAYKREIEIADDPRLTGALGRDAAPQVPVIGS